MRPILLFADRLPPLIGGMEMHAGAFIEHFTDHPRFPLAGVVTRDTERRDCLLEGSVRVPVSLRELPKRLDARPTVVFFNSGRWIEDLAELRVLFPDARFVYRTGGNEILKAPLERLHLAEHPARQAWWEARLNATLDQLITNSAYTEGRLEALGLRPELFARCVGGVDARALAAARAESPEPGDGPTRLLCAARFVPYKNHALLLEVFERLLGRGLDLELRLAGDGPLLEDARRQVQEAGLAERVRFLGRLSNEAVCRELVAADALIQLSSERVTEVPGGRYVHAEGMGRSILEALAGGTFVIAPRSGALPEILTPERGLLLELGSAELVADQLTPLLSGPVLRPEPAEGFGWDHYFARYEALWEGDHASVAGY